MKSSKSNDNVASKVTTLVLALFWFGCSSPTSQTVDHQLLLDSSFEIDTLPSFQQWNPSYFDSTSIQFSSDVPPLGGYYSVAISTVWGPKSSLISTIIPSPGDHIYVFSAWAKKVGIGGSMELWLKKPDTLITSSVIPVADTVWTRYTTTDTLSTSSGDTVVVALYGGFSQIRPGTTLFDLCRVEELVTK